MPSLVSLLWERVKKTRDSERYAQDAVGAKRRATCHRLGYREEFLTILFLSREYKYIEKNGKTLEGGVTGKI